MTRIRTLALPLAVLLALFAAPETDAQQTPLSRLPAKVFDVVPPTALVRRVPGPANGGNTPAHRRRGGAGVGLLWISNRRSDGRQRWRRDRRRVCRRRRGVAGPSARRPALVAPPAGRGGTRRSVNRRVLGR